MPYIEELRAILGHRPLIFVGAVVLIPDRHHRLLFQHRIDDETWGLPGGYAEPGETIEETARREVLEETGLTIGKMTLFDIFSGKEFYYKCPNGDEIFPVWVAYVTGDVAGDMLPDGKEGRELRYFSFENLPCKINPQVKLVVKRFIEADIVRGILEHLKK